MVKDLAHLIGETTDYEKKQQLETGSPKSWCKTISNFANSQGGSLIFGVDDDDTIIGLKNSQLTAEKFSRLKYMERRGSGFKKICQHYSIQANYREELNPKFYSDNYDFVLTLYNLNYGFGNRAMKSLPQSSPKFPKVPQSSPILAEQLPIFLNVLRKFPRATIEILAKEYNVSDRMVKKYLKLLKEQGVVRRVGSNRKGYWEIIE
ncbi:MAG: putative DNA binding domain-containing protein [Prevotella sp.]|nr:putative DNA binding domain-containing protein [Prevotella sp.]